MGTQVLTGSRGKYKPKTEHTKTFGCVDFTVTQDTCLESKMIPVKFDDAIAGCQVYMDQVEFDNPSLKDY